MRSTRRGAATLDFALTCALGFVPLIYGVIEYSWFQFQQLQAVAVCQEVIRQAVAVPLDGNPVAHAEEQLELQLAAAAVQGQVDVSAQITGEPPARLLEMDVNITYQPLIGLVPTPSTIRSEWSGRLEDQSEE